MDTFTEKYTTLENFWSQDHTTKEQITNVISPLFTNKDYDIANYLDKHHD